MGFVILAEHWVRIKENEKRDQFLEYTGNLKMFLNMKVKFLPVVIGVLETIPKGLEEETERIGNQWNDLD